MSVIQDKEVVLDDKVVLEDEVVLEDKVTAIEEEVVTEEEEEEEEEEDDSCKLITVDTFTHTIVNGKDQILFTQFEEDNEKMVRIETTQPIIIPASMLKEYTALMGESEKRVSITIYDIQILASILMIVYLFTILGVSVWTFTVYKNVYKIDL